MDAYVFDLGNPPLYLVRTQINGPRQGIGMYACIEAIKDLVDDDNITGWHGADNTQDAARICESGEVEYCVTNEHGLRHHRLAEVKRLQHLTIRWAPFTWAPDATNVAQA